MFEDFLQQLDDADRAAVEAVVAAAVAAVPEATEGRSYGMPALRYRDRPLLGFTRSRQHLSLHPFSAEVVAAVAPLLDGFSLAKGTIRFTADRPVPDGAVSAMVQRRKAELDEP